MIAVALRNLRHLPGGFVATFLSALLGAALLMAFASLIDTASGVVNDIEALGARLRTPTA